MIGEILGQVILEVVAYGIGKAVAIILLPHFFIEPLTEQRSMPPWKWRGFTYRKDGRRYLYTEAIQLLGLAVLLACTIGALAVAHYAN